MQRANTQPASMLRAIAAVVRSPLAAPYKGVLISLITRSHWDEEHQSFVCWPSYETIAEDASVSRATVATTLAALRKAGAFTSEVTGEKGGSAFYRIPVEHYCTLTPRVKGQQHLRPNGTPHSKVTP